VKLAIAATLVAVLAAWGIHGPGLAGSSAVRAQDKLQIRAYERLRGVGADWARVEMKGQRAVISGVAPLEEELLIARGAVRSAAWNGGWLLGGVTVVDSDAAQVWARREGPYGWRADLDRNRVRLSGAAPERDVVRELGSFAGALFPDRRIVNELVVDPVPPGEGWPEAARAALVVLSRLEVGTADLADFELTVTGAAESAAAADAARASLERLAGVVAATSYAEIRAPRPTASAARAPEAVAPQAAAPQAVSREPAAEPTETAAVAPASTPRAEAAAPTAVPAAVPAAADVIGRESAEARGAECRSRFADALTGGDIRFDVDSAALAAETLPRLEALAAIAADCPGVALRIEGHTDDTGVPGFNQSLSERRAVAVLDRLADLGVARERLTAAGLGATRPVAANDTPEGRQANRRIEIIFEP
jgi:outer membrane protein OmpA-like peptidoglycan-associated protein